MYELSFDGIPGPTHAYSGLAAGNLASASHAGQVGSPKEAALQGLAKMRKVMSLGVRQAVVPPLPRPAVGVLRRLGFEGSDEEVLLAAALDAPELLRACCSASSMWTANAATVAPSTDTRDGRLHLVVANLGSHFHRSIEAEDTFRVLSRIFADPEHFVVERALPLWGELGDEGAANHTRLFTQQAVVHLFGWGRRLFGGAPEAPRFRPRQTLEASESVARLLRLAPALTLFRQQAPRGIDAGAFHTDVLAVGNGGFLMLHEDAFVEGDALLAELQRRLGSSFSHCLATRGELPVEAAVAGYPFNSQVLTLPQGGMAVVAPSRAAEIPTVRGFLERVLHGANPVTELHYLNLDASMDNGGGPACLRLRVPLSGEEQAALTGRVVVDEQLLEELEAWVESHYRDRLSVGDLADPYLLDEVRTALDALTGILKLGPLYDFQRS